MLFFGFQNIISNFRKIRRSRRREEEKMTPSFLKNFALKSLPVSPMELTTMEHLILTAKKLFRELMVSGFRRCHREPLEKQWCVSVVEKKSVRGPVVVRKQLRKGLGNSKSRCGRGSYYLSRRCLKVLVFHEAFCTLRRECIIHTCYLALLIKKNDYY